MEITSELIMGATLFGVSVGVPTLKIVYAAVFGGVEKDVASIQESIEAIEARLDEITVKKA